MAKFKGYPKLKVVENEEYGISTFSRNIEAVVDEEVEGKAIHLLEGKQESGVVFTCECCKFSRRFPDELEAFREGWDTPEYFSGPITCSLCPTSYLILGMVPMEHHRRHQIWKVRGHPEMLENDEPEGESEED